MQDILNKIQIIDDFFPSLIKREILSKASNSVDHNWSYQPFITFGKYRGILSQHKENNTFAETYGFVSVLHQANKEFFETLSEYFSIFATKKLGITIEKIIRINLVFLPANPLFDKVHVLYPHIDNKFPHKNILYYLNDNDADTVFYDTIHEEGSAWNYEVSNIAKRVTPKQNRAVFFDGFIYHSGNVSQTDKRITLNINYI